MRLNSETLRRIAAAAVLPLTAVAADAGCNHGGCHKQACSTGCQPACNVCDMTYANPGYSAGGLPVAADDEPVTVDRGALMPLTPMEARLILHVPSSAVVYFGNQLMTTRGVERVYRIPVTQTGTPFPYPVTVHIPGRAELLTESFRASLTGGLMTEIDVLLVPGEVEAIQYAPRTPDGIEEEVKEELAEEILDDSDEKGIGLPAGPQ